MDIKVYTKKNCIFCNMAKSLLNDLHVQYEEIDVTDKPELFAKLAMSSVPQIYAGDKCLWGYSEISDLNDDWELLKELWLWYEEIVDEDDI